MESEKLKKMTLKELQGEAKKMGVSGYSNLNKDQLYGVLVTTKFVANRKNQLDAINKAREVKDLMKGKWFTLSQLSFNSCPVREVRGKKLQGPPTITVDQGKVLVETLSLFGLMKRNVRVGKATKYRVKFEAAAKAIKAHNENMKVGAVINKGLKEKAENGSR